VTVHEGVVTLRGEVKSYREKETAKAVALRVYGVKALANDLTIRPLGAYGRSDRDIAQDAAHVLKVNTVLPQHPITVSVEIGLLTLKGTAIGSFRRRWPDAWCGIWPE
jgi:osmotically-inducible protein OsmY